MIFGVPPFFGPHLAGVWPGSLPCGMHVCMYRLCEESGEHVAHSNPHRTVTACGIGMHAALVDGCGRVHAHATAMLNCCLTCCHFTRKHLDLTAVIYVTGLQTPTTLSVNSVSVTATSTDLALSKVGCAEVLRSSVQHKTIDGLVLLEKLPTPEWSRHHMLHMHAWPVAGRHLLRQDTAVLCTCSTDLFITALLLLRFGDHRPGREASLCWTYGLQ